MAQLYTASVKKKTKSLNGHLIEMFTSPSHNYKYLSEMQQQPFRYFILNKPFGMESQFVSPYEGDLLGDLSYDFPDGTHAIGRLDKDSEGLLLMTTDKRITALLFQSGVPHKRKYLVQVKHKVSEEALNRLRSGITIKIKGGVEYTTPPCDVQIVEPPVDLFPAPLQLHSNIKTSFLTITLTEGKFHQVRKMVAAVSHRCIRLIRLSIEDLHLGDVLPGEIKEIDQSAFFLQLNLERSN